MPALLSKLLGTVSLLLLFVSISPAQNFTTYARLPNTAPKALYGSLTQDSVKGAEALAEFYYTQGTPDSLAHYAEMMLTTAHRAKRPIPIRANLLRAIAARELGTLDRSIALHRRAMTSLQPNQEPALFVEHLIELSKTYTRKGTLDAAKKGFGESRKLITKHRLTDTALTQRLLLSEAQYFFRNKQLDRAQQQLDSLVNFTTRPNDKVAVAKGLLQARIDQALGNTLGALERLAQLQGLALSGSYFDLYTDISVGMGMLYASLGELQNAEIALSSAYGNSLSWNRLDVQRDIANALQKVKRGQGDYENAYALLTQERAISQEIRDKQDAAETRRLEVEYGRFEQDRAITELRAEQFETEAEVARQKSRQLLYLIMFLVILVPVVALLVVYYQKLQTQSALASAREKQLASESALAQERATFEAQQKERERIGRELHDGIGGNLAAIKLQLSQGNASHDSAFAKTLQALDDTYVLVREISHDLVSTAGSDLPLTQLIQNYVGEVAAGSDGLEIEFVAHPEPAINALDGKLRHDVFACARELLVNGIKHANATHIELSLTCLPNELQLMYEDDGKGFDTSVESKGIGLSNLRARTAQHDGSVSIDSNTGRGTTIGLSFAITST